MSSDANAAPGHHVVSRPWGAVVIRTDTGGPEVVYHASNRWVASYAARTQYPQRLLLRTWEEGLVVLTPLVASFLLAATLDLPVFFAVVSALIASTAAVFAMRGLASRACTARYLDRGKAIRGLVTSGNEDLIDAAIGQVVAFDTDPKNAGRLVAELNDAWRAAMQSSASGRSEIIAALRRTAEDFPTTDDAVEQVRRELAGVRRSLSALEKAQRALDASTSTADLADPPEPPESLDLLRAASQTLIEDAQVVLEVAEEQRARRGPSQP